MPRLFQLVIIFLSVSLLACSSDPETAQTNSASKSKPNQSATPKPAAVGRNLILFFGNSITAGAGVDANEAFPARVGEIIDSVGLKYTVVNAGLSGETSAGGKSRIGWVLRQPVSMFVLELGANDGLRGIDLASTRRNLQAILDTVKLKSPEAKLVIAGMQIPPNLGVDYTRQFRVLFKELADKNDATLIPFLLDRVGGIPRLNQRDGIHPTPEGHRIVAKTVWKTLEPVLRAGGDSTGVAGE